MSLNRKLNVLRWLARDAVMKRAMPAASAVSRLRYALAAPFDEARALRHLLAAHRYSPSASLTARVVDKLPAIQRNVGQLQDLDWLGPQRQALDHVAGRSIVLKWPQRIGGALEKGVLLVSFTTSFPYFYEHVDIEQLQRYFSIVLEPSWAGYGVGEILFWARRAAPPVVVQATEKTDFDFIAALRSNLVPVDFGASNWVDERLFFPVDGVPKQYDCVYVGNYRPIKRHHVLFDAIRRLRDPTYRAALACTPWGGGSAKQTVHDLARHYGVERNVEIFEGLAPAELNRLLSASKVNVLLSLKEGSNRSLFEGFFANVPGIALRNNVGMNKSYVNAQTGRLIEEGELAEVLAFFRSHWSEFQPRRWALEHIAPKVTTRRLEAVLADLAHARGEPWTTGLRVKVNRPEVAYFDAERPLPLSNVQLLELFARQRSGGPAEIERQLFPAASVASVG
jgi:glycosyltransferase involved in cell wall biosynthesis